MSLNCKFVDNCNASTSVCGFAVLSVICRTLQCGNRYRTAHKTHQNQIEKDRQFFLIENYLALSSFYQFTAFKESYILVDTFYLSICICCVRRLVRDKLVFVVLLLFSISSVVLLFSFIICLNDIYTVHNTCNSSSNSEKLLASVVVSFFSLLFHYYLPGLLSLSPPSKQF